MNYLRITNKGLICPEDLTLIGSSTKRDAVGKIGMFGSGWKYALAWLLRNDAAPKIFSGEDEIKVDFAVKMHRSNAVNVITVNGIETSLTTEMGPKWTGWMAIREVLSNAIDEGEHSITTAWLPEFKGVDEQTVVYIPMNGELSDVMLKFDSYFAFYRKHSWQNENVRIFFKTEESQLNVYRKGIRCFDTMSRSKTDFDFTDLAISEDRLTSESAINSEISRIISKGIPTNILKRLLLEERISWLPGEANERVMENLLELIEDGEVFTTKDLKKIGGMLFTAPNSLTIPSNWFKKLQDLGLIKSPFESMSRKQPFMRTDAKNMDGFSYQLSAFNIKLPVYSGKCESDLFYDEGSVYVKDDTALNDKELVGELFYNMSRTEIISLLN